MRRAAFWRVWRWPIALAVASGVGLVVALLGDGPWDVAASCLLAGPIVVCLRCGLKRRDER